MYVYITIYNNIMGEDKKVTIKKIVNNNNNNNNNDIVFLV